MGTPYREMVTIQYSEAPLADIPLILYMYINEDCKFIAFQLVYI